MKVYIVIHIRITAAKQFWYTLERRYYADPYKAETVIMPLICGSQFLCSFFPNFESFALFPQNSAVKKIVSHDRTLAD